MRRTVEEGLYTWSCDGPLIRDPIAFPVLAAVVAIASVNRWNEKAVSRRDAIGSQVIDALEAQTDKETGNEEE